MVSIGNFSALEPKPKSKSGEEKERERAIPSRYREDGKMAKAMTTLDRADTVYS